MEALNKAIMKGEQSISWSEFQAVTMEAHDSVRRVEEGGALDRKEDEPKEGAKEAESGVKVQLENGELWSQFDDITNEMIITKAGRYARCKHSMIVSLAE